MYIGYSCEYENDIGQNCVKKPVRISLDMYWLFGLRMLVFCCFESTVISYFCVCAGHCNNTSVAVDNINFSAYNAVSGDIVTFHERCGTLVKLTNNRCTAERQRPLDEFNNGVVMTARPLRNDERFEVSISVLRHSVL